MDLPRITNYRTAKRALLDKFIQKMKLDIQAKLYNEVEIGLTQLLSKESNLVTIHQQLELLSPLSDVAKEIEDNEKYADEIIAFKVTVKQFLATKLSQPPTATAISPTTAGTAPTIRLPKLQITPFHGDLQDWVRFLEQFESGVHTNVNLSKIDKFNYLRGFLAGQAAITIQGLTLSEANYQIALDLLKTKYGKTDVLINEHVSCLLKTTQVVVNESGQNLRKLLEDFRMHLRALEALGAPVSTMGTLLGPVILHALPQALVLEWNRKSQGQVSWDIAKLLDFIQVEVEGIEQAWRAKSLFKKNSGSTKEEETTSASSPKKSSYHPRPTSTLVTSGTKEGQAKKKYCIFCEGYAHGTSTCEINKTNEARRAALRKSGRCFKCLGRQHRATACSQDITCYTCQGKHHTLLCPKRSPKSQEGSNKSKEAVNQEGNTRNPEASAASTTRQQATVTSIINQSKTSVHTKKRGFTTILQTMRLWVRQANRTFQVTCLMDGGSERTFVTSAVVRRLKLSTPLAKESLQVNSFGGQSTTQASRVVPLTLTNALGVELSIEAYEVPEICHGVTHWETGQIQAYLNGLPWSQSMGSSTTTDIDILIGADWYWKVMTGKVQRLSSYLMALETMFGWVLQGREEQPRDNQPVVSMLTTIGPRDQNTLDQQLQRFWELDQSGILAQEEQSQATLQDVEVLENFQKTTIFTGQRYQVRIPWNERQNSLSRNYDVAQERLRRLIFKLHKNEELFRRYQKGIQAYLQDGHAEEVPKDSNEGHSYYMPHQAIIHEERKTTKFRIVFDASSHGKDQLSLNDCQHVGPNLNPNILDLLLRFRTYRIGITSDIEKAFLQIELNSEDRNATRFVWTDQPWPVHGKATLKTFRMTRVTFGMKASPFLLAATIRLHAKTTLGIDSPLYQIINENMYVDDLLTGGRSTQEGHQVYQDSKSLLAEGGFKLTKWATNDVALRQKWVDEGMVTREEPVELLKILGLMWDPDTDHLGFKTERILAAKNEAANTKRGMLELLARIFDPLGFLVPALVIAKCLLQDIWRQNLFWDEEIQEQERSTWLQWKESLECLPSIKMPRWCSMQPETMQVSQLHVFCDATPRAYGTVAYILIKHPNQPAVAQFVAAKSRIAPIKLISVPRLELLACLTGARLAETIRTAWAAPSLRTSLWTDSMVALQWIQSIPSKWKIFIGRRVQEIQLLSENKQWRHCPTKFNAADVISRGQSLQELKDNEEWWFGPQWLTQPEEEWPQRKEASERHKQKVQMEAHQVTIVNATTQAPKSTAVLPYQKYSSWQRLLRITTWILRFTRNCRAISEARQTESLTLEEIRTAITYWLKRAQEESFPQEKKALMNNQEISRNSSLQSFNPFLDKVGLIRVGGRLRHASFQENQKHPILLKGGGLTDLFIASKHQATFHGGVQATLIKIRETAWILQGRQAVRKVINQCMTCRRWQVKPATVTEAPLPPERVNEAIPFEVTGLDFAGPLLVKEEGQQRKVYICLFTCAVTRAIHLELAASQSTKSFLLAFRRFVARRGGCRIIHSDNAAAFKQTDQLLQESVRSLKKPEVQDFATSQGIEWKFIPPKAAWWGGFYERLIGTVKRHLRRVLGSAFLAAEELNTILTEIEAIVNSRPLSHLSEDPDDNSSLTPAHFLLGKASSSLPESLPAISTSPTKEHLLRRWQYRKRLMNSYWKQWREEYILQLQTMHRQKTPLQNSIIKEGDIVLLQEERIPRGRWKLARVKEVKTGRDGLVRSVVLQKGKGETLRRAIQHICPMELS